MLQDPGACDGCRLTQLALLLTQVLTVSSMHIAIVVANRKSSRVIDEDSLKNLESKGGLAILEALVNFSL